MYSYLLQVSAQTSDLRIRINCAQCTPADKTSLTFWVTLQLWQQIQLAFGFGHINELSCGNSRWCGIKKTENCSTSENQISVQSNSRKMYACINKGWISQTSIVFISFPHKFSNAQLIYLTQLPLWNLLEVYASGIASVNPSHRHIDALFDGNSWFFTCNAYVSSGRLELEYSTCFI